MKIGCIPYLLTAVKYYSIFLNFVVSYSFSLYPEEQLIKTNATNILIRSLQLNKDKNEARDAKHKAANGNSRSKRCGAF